MLTAFFFLTQVSRKVPLPLTQHPIALKVLRCNNYQRYKNSGKLFPNVCIRKHFLVLFSRNMEKRLLAWMFCFAVRHEENKGMDFLFLIKGRYKIWVWPPERVESRQVRKRSAQIWPSFISVAVACWTDGVWASRRAMLVQEKPKSM